MGINIADNFNYQGAKPLDSRIKYATVAAMAAQPEATLYDGCLAYVVGVDKYYKWLSTNTSDPSTAKWREFTTGGGGGGGGDLDTELDINSHNAVENQAIARAINDLRFNAIFYVLKPFGIIQQYTERVINIAIDNIFGTPLTYRTIENSEE